MSKRPRDDDEAPLDQNEAARVPKRWASQIVKIHFSHSQLISRTQELAKEISTKYLDSSSPLKIVVMLKGAFMFASELVKHLTCEYTLDFLTASSYGDSKKSSGAVELISDVGEVESLNVLVVEDIVDSGTTLTWLREHFKSKKARSVSVASLFDKKAARPKTRKNLQIDFVGFQAPNAFLVGFGLDYAQQYRGVPFVAEIAP